MLVCHVYCADLTVWLLCVHVSLIFTTVCLHCMQVTCVLQYVLLCVCWSVLVETGDPGPVCMFYTERPVWVLDRNHQILPAQHHLKQ